jgi:hypothetical protein
METRPELNHVRESGAYLPRRTLLQWLGGATAAAYGSAWGQPSAAFPSRPLRMIVGFAPGGAADALARIIAQGLSSELRQQVIVDNKPGAEGILAAQALLAAPADGHTLMLGTNTAMVSVPLLKPSAPYDPFKQFTPISTAGQFSMFLLVPSSFAARNIKEFLAEISRKPGQYNSASSNSASELAMLQLLGKERQVTNVRYKGDVPAMTDLVGGQIQMLFTTGTTAPGFVKDGRARALLTLQNERSVLLPEVPTAREAGLGALTILPWAGFFGPARMPTAVTDSLSQALQKVLQQPAIKQQLAQQGFDGYGMAPERFMAFFRSQYDTFDKMVREFNVKFE